MCPDLPYHMKAMAQQAPTQDPKKDVDPEVAKKVEKKVEKKTEAKPEAKVEEKPKYQFQILADHQARWEQSEHWKTVQVGHAWVRLVNPIGLAESWGYWPAEEVPVSAPWASVRGEVRNPDNEHMPAGQSLADVKHASFEIDQAAADRVTKAATNRVTDPGVYNLLNHNCADFAVEMAKAAGVDVPMSLLSNIANPNMLYSSLAQIEAGKAAAGKKTQAAEGDEKKK
jgi:hypothetical protein